MTGARALNLLAHQDDDLLFMNPAVGRDIASGWGVRTVYLTAGDAGTDETYWSGREDGARAAYAHMADVADEWTDVDLAVAGRTLTMSTLDALPHVGLVFMRLPDGNLDGSGFPSTGRVSLQRLWTGAAASLDSLDGAETYTASQLVSTLAALMADYAPDVVRLLDFVGAFGDGDHHDHYASAYFGLAAHRAYGGARLRVGHQGYMNAMRPQNLDARQASDKTDTFLVYAAHDSQVPQTAQALGVYAPWVARRYTVGTGDVAALADVTASSADATTGQVAARAVDGYILGYPDNASHEWATVGGGAGSWLTLTWSTPHTPRSVVLYDRPNEDDHVTGGTLLLDGATSVATGPLGGWYEPTIVDVPGTPVTTLTFRVDAVSATTQNVGLAEIEVHDANIAPDAKVTASSQSDATGQIAARAIDGHAGGYPLNPQQEWATLGGGVGSWLHLSWATPREVRRVVLFDRPNPDDHIVSATLGFSDGSTVPVGELDPTGGPTAVDLAPRLTTWLMLTVTAVSPSTQNVGLAEIQVEGD